MARITLAVLLTVLVVGSNACDFGSLDQMEDIPPQCLSIYASAQQMMTEQMSAADITDTSGMRNAMLSQIHTVCRGIIEPYPDCLDGILKVAKCKDGDKFVQDMLKVVPEEMKSTLGLEYIPDQLNHIINEVTVADLKFYSSALFMTAKEQCLHDPAYLLSDEKFENTMACMTSTFGDEGPNSRNIEKFTRTMQEQAAKLLQINWLTHGKPLSVHDCKVISDLLDTVKSLFTLPSCQDYVDYSMRYVKHFEDLICPVKNANAIHYITDSNPHKAKVNPKFAWYSRNS